MATPPTVSTEWASSGTALVLQPTAVQRDKGWDTDDGTLAGVPQKPTMQQDNGWQANVHEWIQFVATNVGVIQLMPAGSIIAVMPNLAGADVAPASGAVIEGWMLCDGTAIPGGQTLSGTLPKLDDDRFIQGSLTSGLTGGVNSRSLTQVQMPNHTHGDGGYTTSITGGPFASSSHYHNTSTNVHVPVSPRIVDAGFGDIGALYYKYYIGSSWTANWYIDTVFNDQAFSSSSNSSLTVGGQTQNAPVVSLGGSNTVVGTSGPIGSGAAYDTRPSFMSTQFLIKVI